MLKAETLAPGPNEMLPAFTLPEAGGGRLRVADYHMRQNLVLFFAHDAACSRCRDTMKALAAVYPQIQDHEAELLIILAGPITSAATLKVSLELPCPVVSDETLTAHAAYGATDARGEAKTAIFIASRFRRIYEAVIGDHADLPPPAEILEWLQFVVLQCSECDAG